MINKLINGGKGTQPNYERNDKLVRDYLALPPNSSIIELVSKYKISAVRIYQILNQAGIYPQRRHNKPKKGGE